MIEALPPLNSGEGLLIHGFHPDLFLPLIRAVDSRLFITVPDDSFSSITKYLSPIWDDESVVFIAQPSGDNNVPPGLACADNRLIMRAKELLAGGLGPIQTIFCSMGGLSLPVLGCGIENKLRFSGAVSFDDCHDFLVKENYGLVDFVTMPGEFSVRGGIIDVFPFSSICPCRINFLDDIPTVFRFNIDSQLTTTEVENFILSSIANNSPCQLMLFPLKSFYM